MACLETTFLIDILRRKESVRKLKDEIDKTESLLSITAPSIMEMWLGAILSKLPDIEKGKVSELLSSLAVLPFDERSAKESVEIESVLLKDGEIIGIEDIMIAGIVKTNGKS